MSRFITLTTDFGYRDPFVGIMKGVVASINPAATLIDLTHGVMPQDVTGGALALAAAVDFYPKGSIHVAVVDPEVGGDRLPILVETDCAYYIGPDNGLLSLAVHRQRLIRVVHLSNPEYHLRPTSRTFHGRDIFAPTAAYISAGVSTDRLGDIVEAFKELSIPAPDKQGNDCITGEVIYVDGFGNLITNIRREHLDPLKLDSIAIYVGNNVIRGLSANYASAGSGNYLALVNSWGHLEISCCNRSAQERLGSGVGTPVVLKTGTRPG